MNSEAVEGATLLSGSEKIPIYEASHFKTSRDRTDFLGCGSFAAVRKCWHDEHGHVVVKCFCISGSDDAMRKAVSDIEREAAVLSRINHENIVKIHAVTHWGQNNHGIVMEAIEGGSLEDFILNKKLDDIPWRLRHRFMYQISVGLSYLHHHDDRRFIIHGDLKPQNILLTPEFHVKIADFGSANIIQATGATKLTTELRTSKQHTVYYSAPEFLKDPSITRTRPMDVYSVSMIGYEIVTRHTVYSGVPYNIVYNKLLSRHGLKPDSRKFDQVEVELEGNEENLHVFQTLKDVVVRSWNQDPEMRPDIRTVRDQLCEEMEKIDKAKLDDDVNQLKAKLNRSSVADDDVDKVPLNFFNRTFNEIEENQPVINAIELDTKLYVSEENVLANGENMQIPYDDLAIGVISTENISKSRCRLSRNSIFISIFVCIVLIAILATALPLGFANAKNKMTLCETRHVPPDNGSMTCENNLKCQFECDRGFRLVGSNISVCQNLNGSADVSWSKPAPICKECNANDEVWSMWSDCTSTCTGTRTRRRLCGSKHEVDTDSCGIRKFVGGWSVWSSCPVTCGGGVRTRNRPICGVNGQGMETLLCSSNACPEWSFWSNWNRCSRECGRGSHARVRTCVLNSIPAQPGCAGESLESKSCDAGYGSYTNWSLFSPCTRTCGNGTMARLRMCCVSNSCPQETQEEIFSCNIDPGRWSSWTSWSDCPVTCGEEHMFRRRRHSCTNKDDLDIKTCDVGPGWTGWSSCCRTISSVALQLRYRDYNCGQPYQLSNRTCPSGETVGNIHCNELGQLFNLTNTSRFENLRRRRRFVGIRLP